MIQVNEKDSIMDHRNLDSVKIAESKSYLAEKLNEFKKLNESTKSDYFKHIPNPNESLSINKKQLHRCHTLVYSYWHDHPFGDRFKKRTSDYFTYSLIIIGDCFGYLDLTRHTLCNQTALFIVSLWTISRSD